MDKTIFYLSGLPRSGSTLLGSLIGQREDFTVTPTSPLLDLLCFTNEAFDRLYKTYTYDKDVIENNIYKAIVDNFYKHLNTKYILDKHRGHPRNIKPLRMFTEKEPKVICTIRPLSEIITSYLKLIEKNEGKTNFVDEDLKRENKKINTANRAEKLWTSYISDPYQSVLHGLKNDRKNLFFVHYDELVNNPKSVLSNIYSFLGIDDYSNHNFNKIENRCSEDKDSAWGLDNLHKIRPALKKESSNPKDVLGPYLTSMYDEFNIKV